MKLSIIHRGSQTARMIIEEAGIPKYKRGVKPEVIVNYGVVGERFKRWKELNPWGAGLLMINRPIGLDKFQVIKKAEDEGIKCPETRSYLD